MGADRNGRQELEKERYIRHGNFVNDKEVTIERVVGPTHEPAFPCNIREDDDGPGLMTAVLQTLGCPASGRRQEDLSPLSENLEHNPGRQGFTGPGSTRKNTDRACTSVCDSVSLFRG